MNTLLTLRSRNKKTGPIPVSTSSAKTCPPSCPLQAGGCFAKGGPLAIHWRNVTAGAAGLSWPQFLAAIAKLPAGQLWRHNQAGDLPGCGDTINRAKLAALVIANHGRRGFTYTHKPLTGKNLAAIADANRAGFTVNVSANSLAHADALLDNVKGADAVPVVVVLPADLERESKKKVWTESLKDYRDRIRNLKTAGGRKVTICPAAYLDTNCKDCKLCAVPKRKTIVGFPAHGAGKNKANAIATD